MLAVEQQGKLLALPLQHTKFDTVVVGTVAGTTVTQIFANPFDQPIEAIYMFPLHERAAVDDYWLTVGEKSTRGEMLTREQARAVYRRAKHDGHTASLLEQQRPNVFTQHVANISPGESIEISIHVVQPLEQDDGVYSLVLPTVVGPRYVPSTVADADKITAPSIPEGYVTCADLDVSVSIESGLRPRTLRSKFHAIDIQREGDVALIELVFPKMSEGRPYTQAHILRAELGYGGRIRAVGEVRRDLLFFLFRVGVDEAILKDADEEADATRHEDDASLDRPEDPAVRCRRGWGGRLGDNRHRHQLLAGL
jgi:uncharacterized protein (DUF934 family)